MQSIYNFVHISTNSGQSSHMELTAIWNLFFLYSFVSLSLSAPFALFLLSHALFHPLLLWHGKHARDAEFSQELTLSLLDVIVPVAAVESKSMGFLEHKCSSVNAFFLSGIFFVHMRHSQFNSMSEGLKGSTGSVNLL